MRKEKVVSFVFVLIIAVLLFGVVYVLFQPPKLEMTGHAVTDSQLGNLTVAVQTSIACTWSDSTLNVSFGSSLDPGTVGGNATGNYNMSPPNPTNGTMYNVTVDVLSTSAADITITGEDLVYSGNILKIGNVSYAVNSTNFTSIYMNYSESINITTSAVDMIVNEAVGSTAWYRLWIDIPAGVVAGSYIGNYTLQCEQA